MRHLLPALLATAAIALTAQSAAAGGPAQPVDAASLMVTDGPGWLGSMAGEKLVAVDGSTLTLSASEGGLAIALISQNGIAQRTSLAFMSDRLGTISDDADAGHVTGFFRETDNGLEAQFGDGRTESLVANTAGGISLTIRDAAGGATCTSWYPADHVFSAAERKAALDAYAAHLGLEQKTKRRSHAASVCVPGIRVVKNKISPRAAQGMITVSHPDTTHVGGPRQSLSMPISAKSSMAPSLVPVIVRASDVHLIDAPTANVVKASLAVPTAIGAPTIQSAQIVQPQPAPPAVAVPEQTASLVPVGTGASDCLTVESDGANLGFRNHCAYGVQFAYCLQRASDAAAACDAGTKTGAVSANAFAAVLLDTNIRTADADHDFRWVACSGNTGDVVPHLDRSDPPVGRCVRSSAL